MLDDPALRPSLETRLARMLTPLVLAHLPSDFPPGHGPNAMGDWIATRRARAQVFVVERDADLIGLLFLFRPDPASTDLHLGYLFAEEAWGQGYATELLSGLLAQLRPQAPLTLRASVTTGNPASARVLRKSGFRSDKDQPDKGLLRFHLSL
ncbi:GNAT family N-acetyltransferase [Maliponia aquimaris]|uniref:N-acetyltransferase domain-containing protein n=1 Tax=Maliponia aquimaris TaxID=1673631 RepID=A0A238JPM5_9RHOB|nr:GNAT family N-acetyltransferase [Maliponia aquimaris]SMX31716.1 hypothetical protein MAA8898_00015 [Maliponia aquimaris]